MSKKIKALITILAIVAVTSTTALASPISTTNTFDGERGDDVVTQSDGTETQYYQTYDNVIYNNLPSIVKTVTQGEKGNTLKYNLNFITNPNDASDVTHSIQESEAYVTLNNIERESGFGKLRLVYSTQSVTVTFNGTTSFNAQSILKAKTAVMDNGNLAYAELGNDQSQYLYNAVGKTGVSTCEIKDPGLYVVQSQNATLGHGLTELVYIGQQGENITNTATSNVAVPTTVDFNVSGNHNFVPMYSLSGSNYIRVRDLAYILNGTSKQISVYHNDGTDVTTMNTYGGLGNQDNHYIADGTELTSLPAYTMSAEPSIHNLAKNGSTITPSMYTINGQDFVSLKALDSILGLNMQVYSDGIMIDASATAVSSSPIAVLVNSSAAGYATKVDNAKILGYPTIDTANKSTEQVMSELSKVQGLTTVKVWDPKYTSDLINAIRTKYKQQF